MLFPTARDITEALKADPPTRLARMRQWAQNGSTDAQLVLGQMLLDGHDKTAAPDEAVSWFVKAGREGHPMAMNMVGRCYENGWGIAADQETATAWFRNAAQAGLDWGMYNYATSLALGRGCNQDRPAAFEWLTRAVAQDHAKSMNILGGFYEDGWACDKSMNKARELYLQAAKAGDFRGWFNLGRLDLAAGHKETAAAYFIKARETATPAFLASMNQFLTDHGL